MRSILRNVITACLSGNLFLALAPTPLEAQKPSPDRTPQVIQLDPAAVERSGIFQGPPQTYTMKSGYMVLAPKESVGKHSTRENEEAVIVLAGEGEMRIHGGAILRLRAYSVAYCPPQTEHDVVNTGSDTLRYIWLVARAQQ